MSHEKRVPLQALRDARAKVRAESIARAAEVIHEVDGAMRGRPVSVVLAELERRLVPLGLQASASVAEYARAISEGTLTQEPNQGSV